LGEGNIPQPTFFILAKSAIIKLIEEKVGDLSGAAKLYPEEKLHTFVLAHILFGSDFY